MIRENLRNLDKADSVIAHNTVPVKWTDHDQLYTELGGKMTGVVESVHK